MPLIAIDVVSCQSKNLNYGDSLLHIDPRLPFMCAWGALGRIVIPGFPLHATQRGNRRQPILFEPGDQAVYRDLLAQRCRTTSFEVWA
jgi:hypothetical protein